MIPVLEKYRYASDYCVLKVLLTASPTMSQYDPGFNWRTLHLSVAALSEYRPMLVTYRDLVNLFSCDGT